MRMKTTSYFHSQSLLLCFPFLDEQDTEAFDSREILLEEDPATTMKFVYHSNTQMNSILKAVEEQCSQIARTYSIGRSMEGRDLLVIEFSNNPGKHELCKLSSEPVQISCTLRSFTVNVTSCSGA